MLASRNKPRLGLMLWLTNFLIVVLWSGGDSSTQLLVRSGLWVLFWGGLSLKARRLWILPLASLPWAWFLLQALLQDDCCSRQALLYSTKLSQIDRGRLRYLPGWGWVDVRHRLLDVWEQLQTDRPLLVSHLFFGYPGLDGRQAYRLQFQGAFPERLQKLRMIQMLGERCEAEEQRLPWWTGGPTSAYNPDDLSSVYFTIFELAHPSLTFDFESVPSCQRRWRAEGFQVVQARVRGWRDFHPPGYSREYENLMEQLELVKLEPVWKVQGPFHLKQ
ncbi:hypothetical protein JST97_30755 [bacterium]|nr:hypothetical protein [bacterium]